MITTIAGNNIYLIKGRLGELTSAFLEDHGDLALENFDGEEVELNQILDAVQNLPFLSVKKMVVVKKLSANKTVAEKIEQIIESVDDAIDLIIYEPNPDKRTVFYKTLKNKTVFEEYIELEPQNLSKWLADEAKNIGADLSISDANYLIDRVGSSQVPLANELAKLSIYDKKITKDSIDLLTVKTPRSKVFDLLDAAFAGQKQKALAIYDEQREQKVEPQEIIAMFVWQLRLLTVTKLADGKNPNQIAKDLGVSPWPVTKASGMSAKLSRQKLEDMVGELINIDTLGKTKPINLDDALKSYIISL